MVLTCSTKLCSILERKGGKFLVPVQQEKDTTEFLIDGRDRRFGKEGNPSEPA